MCVHRVCVASVCVHLCCRPIAGVRPHTWALLCIVFALCAIVCFGVLRSNMLMCYRYPGVALSAFFVFTALLNC